MKTTTTTSENKDRGSSPLPQPPAMISTAALPPSPLVLAIDFDHTWTADPYGWLVWYEIMTARGHVVILATGREAWSDDMLRAHLPADMPIVYCGRELKELAVRRAGWGVDIWIDDTPGTIQPCRILRDG